MIFVNSHVCMQVLFSVGSWQEYFKVLQAQSIRGLQVFIVIWYYSNMD